MELFLVIALLVIISAIYSYLNARFFKLPGTIGIITIAIAVSIITIIVDKLDPAIARYLTILAKHINFSATVLNIMLGFLLFAGSFTSNTKRLRRELRPVFILSTLSVILSAAAFGTMFYYGTMLFNIHMSYMYCLLFGALISPTDPVAVGAIIRNSKLPVNLATIISGESLFNDGVGLVMFITMLEAIRSGIDNITFAQTAFLFIREVFGGVILGLGIGYIAYRLMRSVTDFQTIVLVSLSVVMAVSVIASYLEFSIPIAVVCAGLLVGNRTINLDEKERSHEALERFWKLIDEMLNTILFVMIGLQMINLPYITNYWLTGGIAIVLILIARWLSIILPLTFMRRSLNVNYKSINILTWGGVRGAISIALALSLPYSPYRHVILCGSYFIVIFSVVVQGLTLNRLINFSLKDKEDSSPRPAKTEH
ncbi:sodium:proton antiporter [Mucilaginibacter sp. L3T2-6]|uniref:cation:proton antiporter n=1 Tax=Mucilaginibacter sp. L3T2-6 TaxID=3062491 RepID=UPI00267707EC|nr:sodium:proton antiporter [Mucilaginibacter sp. L3T2-6]MDO3643372.1 sodium:proton antiporter [Mucilaginibacter sp. L3T2-6]MDV6215695.1 sodium:proton antiporter [Mucilaginibacter sp. L3T2-6]